MFLSHIAFSLELIALALGSLLVLKCCIDCGFHYPASRRVNAENTSDTTYTKNKDHKHFGFLKFIGYVVIIASVLGLLCTAISYGMYVSKYGIDDARYQDYRLRNVNGTEQRLEQNDRAVPPTPKSDSP